MYAGAGFSLTNITNTTNPSNYNLKNEHLLK